MASSAPNDAPPISSMDKDSVTPTLVRLDDEGSTNHDIAIIGFAFEFPGANTEAAFWELIIQGRSTHTTFPVGRLNSVRYHDPHRARSGTSCTKEASFFERDIGAFDAKFFGMTIEESAAADPQQRILLETTYHALENAGISMQSIQGSNTSVHTGYFTADYFTASAKDPEKAPKYAVAGMAGSMLSNKISSFFDVTGPSVTVDTACSSSLVALDLACQSIRQGNSTLGIVAGCNLLLSPDLFITLSSLGFLSPDGVCHSFDHRANGYGRGEGVGVLVIKGLAAAVKDGDTIRAVIRATGTNQNGRTNLAQPSKELQKKLIQETYQKAELDKTRTGYFEAHGTGTALGDPLEAMAIGDTFAPEKESTDPLYIGSVKANVGHLEGAAGIAGIIKTILVLEKGLIPPIANLEQLNENIDADFLNLKFPQAPISWSKPGLRRASVNSFGFGGTNSHAVLDDALHYLQARNLQANHCTNSSSPNQTEDTNNMNGIMHTSNPKCGFAAGRHQLLVWSAHQQETAIALTNEYRKYVDGELEKGDCSDENFHALIHTLTERRSLHRWRIFAIASSLSELKEALVSLGSPMEAEANRRAAFVFTGQGAQWLGMGKDLHHFSLFRESIYEADSVLEKLGCSWKARDFLIGQTSQESINEPRFAQPLCTILQIALVDLLVATRVTPRVVLGHSSGEIAAAYATGAISRSSALKIAYFRGLFSSEMAENQTGSPKGGMIAVGAPERDVLPHIKETLADAGEGVLVVACINSPKNITLSGDEPLIFKIQTKLQDHGMFTRILKVPVAYHSPRMTAIEEKYCRHIGAISPGRSPPQHVNMISTVTATRVSNEKLRTPSYWVRNLMSPVRFGETIRLLYQSSSGKTAKKLDLSHKNSLQVTDIIEIGPHSTLQGPIRETFETMKVPTRGIPYRFVSARDQSSLTSFLQLIGGLHCAGFQVDLAFANRVNEFDKEKTTRTLVTLPRYPFDHSKIFWSEPRVSKELRLSTQSYHELIGLPTLDYNPLEPSWGNVLSNSSIKWLEDHKIGENIVFPAAGMVVMAIEAISQAHPGQTMAGYEIRDLAIYTNLIIPPGDRGVEIQFRLKLNPKTTDRQASWASFSLYRIGETFLEICSGRIKPEFTTALRQNHAEEPGTKTTQNVYLKKALATFNLSEYCQKDLYDMFRKNGYTYGPSFQNIRCASRNGRGQALGYVEKSASVPMNYMSDIAIQPPILDSIFQLVLFADSLGQTSTPATWVPTYVKRLWISSSGSKKSRDGEQVQVLASRQSKSARLATSSLWALDTDGCTQILVADGLETTLVTDTPNAKEEKNEPSLARKLCYNMVYEPDLSLMGSEATARFLQQNISRHSSHALASQLLASKHFIFSSMARIAKVVPALTVLSEQPHLQSQLSWIADQVASAATSPPRRVPSDWLLMSEACKYEDLCSDFGETGPIGLFQVSFCRDVIAMLQGRSQPSQLANELNTLRQYQRVLLHESPIIKGLQTFLHTTAHKSPALNILQVGDVGGIVMECVLATLTNPTSGSPFCRFARYDYAELASSSSPADVPLKELEATGRVQYRALNPQLGLTEQGYEENQFDLVIMANGFGTNGSEQGLFVRKLMQQDGKIIVLDISNPKSLMWKFVAGFFPGWQHFPPPPQGDRNQPLILPLYEHLLRESGFSGPEVLLHDSPVDEEQVMSLIISSVTASQTQLSVVHRPTLVITGLDSTPETDLSESFCLHLRESGYLDLRRASLRQASQEKGLENMLVMIVECEKWLPLEDITRDNFAVFHATLTRCRNVFWLSSESLTDETAPSNGAAVGLARTLRMEYHGYIFATVTINQIRAESLPVILRMAWDNFLRGVNSQLYEPELVQIGDLLHVPRVYESAKLNERIHELTSTSTIQKRRIGEGNIKLKVKQPGLLDTLCWEHAKSERLALGVGEIEIEVKAVGVNFKDCLTALGRIAEDNIGSECAGVVVSVGVGCKMRAGDRVLISALDTFTWQYRCPEQLAAKMPDEMTFVEAAGVATNFVTAYHSLVVIARLRKGESVLIHAGAGGTGQAAIQVAQLLGADIFTTVGSPQKKELLVELYGIDRERILNSRDLSFRDDIQQLTGGKGVDVVLNSLAGDALIASWECVAPYGRFVEIGKKDIFSHQKLPMYQFARNVTFSAVDIAAMTKERPDCVEAALSFIVDMFHKKQLCAAAPTKSFPASQVEAALRYLQSGNNPGKVVVELDPDEEISVSVSARSSWTLASDCTYAIAGGFGGQGRSVAKWMVSKGARHLLLLSRTGVTGGKRRAFVEELEDNGAQIYCPPCDIADSTSLSIVLHYCRAHMPAIKGLVQAAMAIHDSMFDNMSYESWSECLRPKIRGTWNLHQQLPHDLEFFIMFSSTAGIIGSQGQSNYAAGNTFQDRLAAYRLARGQTAISLNLSFLESEGYMAENYENLMRYANVKHMMIMSQPEVLAMLEHYCNPSVSRLVSSSEAQVVLGLTLPGDVTSRGMELSGWMYEPMFANLHQIAPASDSPTPNDSSRTRDTGPSLSQQAIEAPSIQEAGYIIAMGLTAKVISILSLTSDKFDPSLPLYSYGVDSLIAVELRNWFIKVLKVDMAIFEILGGATVTSLGKTAAEKLRVGVKSDVP
ncbi:putative polyketide synthase [Xylaria sp. FL0064]|nr:putative polyketide synthase [Xylaria sp. FL0064]